MKFITSALLAVLITEPSFASDTFFCKYDKYADEGGAHSVSDKFELTFIIDSDNDKAYIVGNQGSSEVSTIPSSEGISFVEITPAGNVMTTTIDKELRSVHSRNTIIFNQITPSQYYGKCTIK